MNSMKSLRTSHVTTFRRSGLVLRQEGHEVIELREVLPVQASDFEAFGYARNHGLFLITCNRDSFLALAAEHSNPGMIVLVRRRSRHATDKDKCGIGDEILPEIGKKSSPAINPENLIVGMPVKTKPVGPPGNRLLEPSNKELLARRHLRAVIRERMDWHISRCDHGSQ